LTVVCSPVVLGLRRSRTKRRRGRRGEQVCARGGWP